jgi:hypothetical protein
MRVREVLPDQIRLAGGLDIPWDEVRELKVSQNTLWLTLDDQKVIEVSGLDSWAMDNAFRSWSRKQRPQKDSPPRIHKSIRGASKKR